MAPGPMVRVQYFWFVYHVAYLAYLPRESFNPIMLAIIMLTHTVTHPSQLVGFLRPGMWAADHSASGYVLTGAVQCNPPMHHAAG